MSGAHQEVEVYETSKFAKAKGKFSLEHLAVIEDSIDDIVSNPEIGEQKKGDLSYLWVHKFKIEGKELLLGYSWVEHKLQLHLLTVGTHENYYQKNEKA